MTSFQHQKKERNGWANLGIETIASAAKGAVIFFSAFVIYSVVIFDESHYLSAIKRSNAVKLHIPSDLDPETSRALSLNLGGGDCQWQPPVYEVPTDIDFYKTAIVGYPSGDKRMIFIQMEALTGWPAKDEWDFEYLGDSNHPFIKANYPHHEGIWGWGTNADQVVLMIGNIRKAIVEYHDILWDIGYAKTREEAAEKTGNLYEARPPTEDFFEWRDLRVWEEIYWYGWFIDYWMEKGLMRDIFTHKITTPEHWNMLMTPNAYTRDELDYDRVVGPDTLVTPSYDPHCANGDISGGCEPVAVISAEKLRDHAEGPAETTAIANVLVNNAKMSKHVISAEAWNCIWTELLLNGKGSKTVVDRPGEGSFSAEMLEEMIAELTRLINKYSSSDWKSLATSNRLVVLLTEHRDLLQAELDELNAGARTLTDKDFLGPKEREKRRKALSWKPNFKYFDDLAREHAALKRRKMMLAEQGGETRGVNSQLRGIQKED